MTVKGSRVEASDADGNRLEVERQSFEAWAGALPRPEDLEKFSEIIPNGAERIMRLTENEQEHRITMEKAALPENFRAQRRGQYLGWTLSLSSIAAAGVSSFLGAHPSVSIAMLSVPVLAVAKALVDSFRD